MMKNKTVSIILQSIIMLYIFTSCNKYLDITGHTNILPINQGSFSFYPDSNILIYKPNIFLTRDSEKFFPKQFKVKLPKGIKYWEFENSSEFSFYYDNEQVIYIRVNLEEKKQTIDTTYLPEEKELANYIESKHTVKKSKYNLTRIPFNNKRKQLFIKKGIVTILLYNIKPDNFQLFNNYLNSFTLL